MTSLNLEYIFLQIYNLIFKHESIGPSFVGLKNFAVTILSILALICIPIIIYSYLRLKERQEADMHKLHDLIHAAGEHHHHHDKHEDKRWRTVLDFITSENPSDWRLAIIEADNMLDSLTKEIGFVGNDLGERLKNAPSDHFKTKNDAWEAHKVRNRIAHEGSNFEFTYREAKRVVELYENVFKEFEVI